MADTSLSEILPVRRLPCWPSHTTHGSWLFLLSLAIAMIVPTSHASATTMMHHTLSELIGRSGLVVEGTVLSVDVQPGDEANVPTTTYQLCDLELVLGEHDSGCIRIEVPGANIEGRISGWVGMPELEVDARYLLFLRREEEYDSPFVGMWQGVFRVAPSGPQSAILSSSGYPVTGLSERGHVQTRRDLLHVPAPSGMIEMVTDEQFPQVSLEEADGSAIPRADFIDLIHSSATERMWEGKDLPQRLPPVWAPRTRRARRVAQPPIYQTLEYIQP